jgi:hypothetical protein
MDVEDLAINSINRLKWWIDFPPRVRDAILRRGPFERKDLTFINTTTDRSEIFIDIRFMEASIKDLEDLHWLIPKASNDENIRLLRRACRPEEKEYTPGVYFLCSHAGTHIMMLIFPSLDTVDV